MLRQHHRSLVVTLIIIAISLIASPAYACSPTPNLIYKCDSEPFEQYWVTDSPSLNEALQSCSQLLPAMPQLSALLFESEVAIVQISDQSTLKHSIPIPSQDVECYIQNEYPDLEWSIMYAERQPYCVREMTFCESYKISHLRKMIFDAKNGKPFLALTSLSVIMIGVVAGYIIGKGAFIRGEFRFLRRLALEPTIRFVLAGILYFLVLIICDVSQYFISGTLIFLNIVFHPSTGGVVARLGLFAFLGALVSCQLRLWRMESFSQK